MFAEHGCLYVYRGKDDEDDAVTVFTDYGVECLKQLIANERAAGRAPHRNSSTE
jgi:hypothetical protein